jgi:hypothetical protein
MAIRYAVATGNWSNTATWNGGTLPTSADDVFTNNFVVTINQNVTVLSLNTTAATGVTNGGTFLVTSGTFAIVADTIQAGSSNCIQVNNPNAAILTITANNINGAITPFAGRGILFNSTAGYLIINGNINANLGIGAEITNNTGFILNGNVITNSTAVGILQNGSITGGGNWQINGFCQSGVGGGTAFDCITNNITNIVTITKAISINNGAVASVRNASNILSSITVKEIEQGVFGQVPITGYVRLSTASGAFYKGVTTGISTRTLSDPADIAGQVPAQSDVRFGVTYQSGSKTGSAYIPAASSVGFGVPVDNTTGTAALTPASVWDAATSSLTTSGSIGERLKNASTVDTTGDQLAALL